ncbi:mechanosensitive ion channel family protein [Rhabdothermincola salaria]|uniref:mechanosensitive ion channel family protein n=1 Tax=Rhabdothermincola salaria TaxID=2903142 RepID=UPI001E602FB0|nr:mechanosensitive ion channel family protein [Rhabdothermincola salaria]MCD9623113.1 mechanosensitive ion channel family protein [Rhabdothermincola salaria]
MRQLEHAAGTDRSNLVVDGDVDGLALPWAHGLEVQVMNRSVRDEQTGELVDLAVQLGDSLARRCSSSAKPGFGATAPMSHNLLRGQERLETDQFGAASPMTRRQIMGPVGSARRVTIVAALAVIAAVLLGPSPAHAQENPLEPLDTSSPQATYLSFVAQVELLEELLLTYEQDRSEANQAAFDSALERTEQLFDFSEVSEANQGEAIVVSFTSLADILNRIPPPAVDEIPDAAEVEAAARATEEFTFPETDAPFLFTGGGITGYTLPGTEIKITRVDEGARADDYVFSAETVSRLPGWRKDVDGLPPNEEVEVRNWVQEEANFTGHLVPRSLVDSLPDGFDRDFLGSPLWKLIVDVVVLGLVVVTIGLWQRWVGSRGTPGTLSGYVHQLTTPVLLLILIGVARRFMDEQVNHSGNAATIANVLVTLVIWASMAWAFWVVTKLAVEWIIATPAIRDESIDAHLLRLLAKVVSLGGAFSLALMGLSRVGVPTIGLGVGAGVAGLAVGLAATSTLENLLGGITVYLDKPFRVHDDIRVDDEFGTVEAIGPRSTRIRRLDDTQVTLPNADLSRAKVTNYSERNHILFVHTVGVRYETTVDQLRTIVSAIDARFRSHPMVLDKTDFPRVRVCGFGASSIDIEVRAHIGTDRYSVFTEVQQELLLLIHEIIEAAGSGFAFPSTTTYLTDDAGLSKRRDSELLGGHDGSVATSAAHR